LRAHLCNLCPELSEYKKVQRNPKHGNYAGREKVNLLFLVMPVKLGGLFLAGTQPIVSHAIELQTTCVA
jgi:hypothetical protein